MKLKVGHWSVERKCQRGVVIQDGLPSDRCTLGKNKGL